MRENKTIIDKIRDWIQDNFFGLIIFLVVTLIIVVIASLFIPIKVSHFPNDTLALNKYNAGVEQRTIIIRSISSIISGISVVIAFVSLLQSKNSELKKERLQVMPFPAYAIPLEDIQYSNTTSSSLIIKQEDSYPESIIQSTFDITIKNIGLGSLVDFEIAEAYYRDSEGKIQLLDSSFTRNFILGKQESIQLKIELALALASANEIHQMNVKELTIVANFNDLLGHQYDQEFTIHSEIQSVGHQNFTLPDGKTKTGVMYGLTPKKVTHTHPLEQ